ncbi:MAG: hypothetical protein AAFR17_04205 [Pseudomonadota bacterium]
MPRTAEAALRAKPPFTQGWVRYREEVAHPSLPTPRIARGQMGGAPGKLIRKQAQPVAEISEIGAQVITITDAEGQVDRLPIPEAMRPMITALEAMISGDSAKLMARFDIALAPDPVGWRVTMTPGGEAPVALTLLGCGLVVTGLDLPQAGGLTRRLRFEP